MCGIRTHALSIIDLKSICSPLTLITRNWWEIIFQSYFENVGDVFTPCPDWLTDWIQIIISYINYFFLRSLNDPNKMLILILNIVFKGVVSSEGGNTAESMIYCSDGSEPVTTTQPARVLFYFWKKMKNVVLRLIKTLWRWFNNSQPWNDTCTCLRWPSSCWLGISAMW